MARTEQGPLRRLWDVLHRTLLRAARGYLRRGHPDLAVYLRGSFASGEPAYGLSDIDVIVVLPGTTEVPGRHRERLERRWQRLCSAIPGHVRVIDVTVYEDAELEDAAGTTALTYGLPNGEPDALFYRQRAKRHYSLRTRPGLYGATRDWLHVAGPDRRPHVSEPAGPERLVAGWLELQYWWRYVARCCLHPQERTATYYSVKFVAGAARIWLWLVEGERPDGRLDTLRRAMRLMPADAPILERAIAARRELAHPSTVPFPDVLAWLVDFSSRLAGFIASQLQEVGATDVSLRWAGATAARKTAVPLVDWKAVVMGEPVDGTLALDHSSPCAPAAIAAAAEAERNGCYVALQAPGVLILPSADLDTRPIPRGALRTIQCAASDPASIAVVRGDRTASFPDVDGWSAIDSARRAVAEHRGRLMQLRTRPVSQAERVALLLSAARAALFLKSVEDGAPELHVSPPDVAGALAERAQRPWTVGDSPEGLERIVRELPGLRGG
jgi:predicted nucleotidyltransferase